MIQNNFHSICKDIQLQYVKCRNKGLSRDAAIASIREEYTCELQDEDDRIAVLTGLVLALCNRHELLESIADEGRDEIKRLRRYCERDSVAHIFIAEIEEKLKDIDLYGDEASYTQKRIYKPNWMVGDVFSHIITYPAAQDLGIMGWTILFYKVGDYIDNAEEHHHLVLVSLCPPDNIPSCCDDLQKLELLPMMRLGERLEYLAQIVTKSRRQENSYDFTKIGCYTNLSNLLLDSYQNENPQTAMPLFGRLKQNDLWPAYEDQVCRLYRKFKRGK